MLLYEIDYYLLTYSGIDTYTSTNIIVLFSLMLMETISGSLCVYMIRTSHDNATERAACNWKLLILDKSEGKEKKWQRTGQSQFCSHTFGAELLHDYKSGSSMIVY